jgi:hypothetical protein
VIGKRLKIKIGDDKYDPGGVHYYYTPPMPTISSMINFELPVLEQKFKKTAIPDFFKEDLINRDEDGHPTWSPEQLEFISQEADRRLNGCWYLIKGKPIYLTGDNYFFMNYWWFDAKTEDGYAEYRYAQTKYFYFLELIDLDENCFGDLFVGNRRFSKTEVSASRIYNTATLEENTHSFVMSLEYEHARKNIFEKIVRSWKVMFEPWRPKHSGTTEPREILNFGNPPKKSKKSKAQQRASEVLNSYIQPLPTKVTALQGKRPRRIFVDEAGTIDQMNIEDFWSTTKQALTLGMKKIIGKISMPCTLEDMKPNAGIRYKNLWDQSDNRKISVNGRTDSGLKRWLKPFWEGFEGFIDEWGFDMVAEAKAYVEAEVEAASDDNKIKLRRQYPRNADDAFGIVRGEAIEADCQLILEDNIAYAETGVFPEQPCEIYESAGVVKIRNVAPTDECLYIVEEPVEGVEYVVGLDGTATDEETSGKDVKNKRSKFAIVVTKKLHIGHRSYCEVAYVAKYPKKRDDMYRMAYHLWVYYNKFGKCKVMPEANAATASPVGAFFTNRGSKHAFMYEPKYIGTDIKEFKDRIGFVRTGQVRGIQIQHLNIQIRMFGNHFRSARLMRNILATGKENTDLSDAFQAAMVGWGNFGNIEFKAEATHSSYQLLRGKRHFDQETGRWVIEQLEQEKEVVIA